MLRYRLAAFAAGAASWSAAAPALTLGFSPALRRIASAAEAGANPFEAYVLIAPDNTVTVLSAHMDMGQGIYTGIATLVAEELDADWARCASRVPPATPSSTATSSGAARSRAPAARPPSPAPGSATARPAPPRGRCWSRRRPRLGRPGRRDHGRGGRRLHACGRRRPSASWPTAAAKLSSAGGSRR